MVRKYWCWQGKQHQKSSGKIKYANCCNKLVNTRECPSIGKYTPTGIRGMVAPKLVLGVNTATFTVRMRCMAVRFRVVSAARQAISTYR